MRRAAGATKIAPLVTKTAPSLHQLRLRRAWLLAVVALATGCASLQQPPAVPPSDPVPAAWTAPAPGAAPAALAQWWTRFDDPVLPALVAQALQASTDVAVAQARLRQARAARELAAAGLQPRVGASASAQGNWREATDRTSESWRAGLDASWEADLWGAGGAGVRAAEASERAGALTLEQARVSVAAEVALTLLQLRGTQAREAIARRNLASQQQTLQITQWRREAGLVTELDVAQARTAVEQTRAQIPALAASREQAMNALAVLTGRAPGALHAELTPRADAAPPAVPDDLALAFPAEVLRQRPDVQAAEQRLAAAAARVEQADLQRLPSFTLGGSIGLSALSLSALGSGAGVASLAASVSVPVFDAGRLQAQVRQQEAARDEAAAGYRASVLAALQEVEDALVSLARTREQLGAQQAAAASARRAAELAEQRYASGLVDFQNVLQSQRTLLGAEDGVAATTTALATAHVRLYKALGGGWTPDPTPTASR
jgi:NodT family efflux transporter outer membrane factor (OMF) lipoprotein